MPELLADFLSSFLELLELLESLLEPFFELDLSSLLAIHNSFELLQTILFTSCESTLQRINLIKVLNLKNLIILWLAQNTVR